MAAPAAAAAPAPITAHLLDDTWADVMAEYKASLASMPAFSAAVHPQVDPEGLLSAIELNEPRTDPMHGFAAIKNAKDLLALGEVLKPSALADEAILSDFTDGLLSLEMKGLQGRSLLCSIGSCAYYYLLDVVEQENPALFAYLMATAKCLDLVFTLAHSVSIREDDEFMAYPTGFCLPVETPTSTILASLQAAIGKMTSEGLKARFSFRYNWLAALDGMVSPVNEQGLQFACAAAASAYNALAKCTRSSELTAPDSRFFRKETAYWIPVSAPVNWLPWTSHAETCQVFRTTLEQLASLEKLLQRRAIYAALDFLEELGMQEPLLVVRSAALLMATTDPNSILLAPNMANRVLETLSRQCGAPIYEKIVDEDKQTIDDMIAYRVYHTKAGVASQQDLQALRFHYVDTVRKWATHVGHALISLAEALLSHRGRCHRRLANLIQQVSHLQQSSWDTDMTTFCAPLPGTGASAAISERELVLRSMVLSSFVTDILLHAMTSFVQLSIELNLLTKPELLPSTWYLLYLCGMRLENTNALYVTNPQMIPPTKTLRKKGPPVHNPVITSRTMAVPPSQFMLRIETTRMLADGLLVFGALANADGLLPLSLPSTSLVTAEKIFNHRFLTFATVNRPEFIPYNSCIQQISVFLQMKERAAAGTVLSQASNASKSMAEHLKKHLGSDPTGVQQRFFAAAEKAARSMFATMSLYEAIGKKSDKAAAFAQFTLQMEQPFHPSIPIITLKPKPKK